MAPHKVYDTETGEIVKTINKRGKTNTPVLRITLGWCVVISVIGMWCLALGIGANVKADERVDELEDEVLEYRKVYDGIKIYEDGTWVYRDEEYYFWNYHLEYVGK